MTTPASRPFSVTQKNNLSDEGAERAILATLMKDPSKMVDCAAKIVEDDFVNENNRYLYGIMLAMFKKNGGKDISYDITSLLTEAKVRGLEDLFIQKSGGEEYITFLTITKEMHIDVNKFDKYLDSVMNYSARRKLITTAEQFISDVFTPELSTDELIVRGVERIDTVFRENATKVVNFTNLANQADGLVSSAKEQKREILGIRTLFPGLDKTIEGLRRQNLIIISAPKKTGKSAFLMNIGLNVAVKQSIPTLMISTEMSDAEILSRALANLSEVPEKDILKGNLSKDKDARLQAAMALMKKGQFYHLNMRDFTMEKVIASTRKFVNEVVGKDEKGQTRECLVLFDYIKMPQAGSGSSAREEKEYKVLGQFADGLKILAGDLDIPIVTACQTNRSGEVANSYELTWFCNTFAELTAKSEKELQNNIDAGVYYGNQTLKIVDNRSGEENHDGINLDFNGHILQYSEVRQAL